MFASASVVYAVASVACAVPAVLLLLLLLLLLFASLKICLPRQLLLPPNPIRVLAVECQQC